MPMKHVRTRIAPSPTGNDLHIGNAYTALINYVFAKKNGGEFLIRIEDTDRTRYVEGSEERIIASLNWLGITHDEGPDVGGKFAPYRQSERLDIYKKYAEELVAKGHAYHCFCDAERLTAMRKGQEDRHEPPMYDGLCKKIAKEEAQKRVDAGEKYVIRLNVPDEGTTTFTDVIRGEISFENKLIDDQVLIKSDGFPTYHLGVVIDDHLMEISHIIRGEEWISSTPKSIMLYKFLGWELPIYAHVSLLRNPDKSKLSKRKHPVWTGDYKARGFLPEAIKNYFGMMAWAFPDGREIFSVNEMIEVFSLEKLQTTAPIFDQEKLRWINGEYLRSKTDEDLIKILTDFSNLAKANVSMLPNIIPLIRDRMKVLEEFESLAGFFFEKPTTFEKPLNKEIVESLKKVVDEAEFTHDGLEHAVRTWSDANGKKAKEVFMELRLAMTGKTVGPPLLESMVVLGKDESLSRLTIGVDN